MFEDERENVMFIVFVYSLLEKIKEFGDLYLDQFYELVKLIVEGVGVFEYVVGW